MSQIPSQKDIVERLSKTVTHSECEDSWYSCPKSEGGCANANQSSECLCGAEDENTLRKDAVAEITQLRSRLDEVMKERDELHFAVARAFPGETRHQTALRYILETELRAEQPGPCCEALKNPPESGSEVRG